MDVKEYYEQHKEKAGVRDYEMFSKAGNRVAHAIAGAAIKKIGGQKRVGKEDIIDLVSKKLNETYLKGKHKEIWDTEPPHNIAFYINKAAEIAGYDWEISGYDFKCEV